MNQLNLGGAEMKDKKKMAVGLFCAVVIASAIGSGTTYHAETKTFDYKETKRQLTNEEWIISQNRLTGFLKTC